MSARSLNPLHPRQNFLAWVVIVCLALAGMGVYTAVNLIPSIGAQGADVLRGLAGDLVVAQLETTVYQFQDGFHKWAYQLGVARPTSPWAAAPIATLLFTPTAPAPTATPRATLLAIAPTAVPRPSAMPLPATPLPPTPTAIPTWTLAPLAALGALPGEGQWSAYLQSPSGQTVAYRTFLQPDPQRPYAVAAVVAFNLDATRLKFVLGSIEPVSGVLMDRSGHIPTADYQPGLLLATFNGGFKARHGQFGAMVNGVTVLPPRNGLGTVALYADGRVRIGAWGTDITPAPDMVAWRQNGPLIIHDSQINPHTADNAPRDWGYTINGATAVWRSGMAISADGRTLYYVAGPSLNISALATAMAATGAAQAMQLDINNYWVHFDAVQANGAKLQAVPLLDAMNQGISRYLKGYSRDYFYVMANGF